MPQDNGNTLNGLQNGFSSKTLPKPPIFDYENPESYQPKVKLPKASEFPQVKEPMTFEMCKDASERQDWDMLIRWPEDLVIYSRYHLWVKENYKSVEDFIKITYFNHVYDVVNGKFVALGKSKEPVRDPQLRRNNFPYAVVAGTHHLVLWSEHNLTPDIVKAAVEERLKGWEYFYFENPAAKKTIPGVDHFHVFVRKPDSPNAEAKLELDKILDG